MNRQRTAPYVRSWLGWLFDFKSSALSPHFSSSLAWRTEQDAAQPGERRSRQGRQVRGGQPPRADGRPVRWHGEGILLFYFDIECQ